MLSKQEVLKVLRSGEPVYKLKMKYVEYELGMFNEVGILRVGNLSGRVDYLLCICIINKLQEENGEDLYVWFGGHSGRVPVVISAELVEQASLYVEEMEVIINITHYMWTGSWEDVTGERYGN